MAKNEAKKNIVTSKVLVAPVITESAAAAMEANKYVFKITREATKEEVKAAIEKVYNVKVEKVNTIHLPRKARIRGRVLGWKAGSRKAIVTLKEGDKIDVFEGK